VSQRCWGCEPEVLRINSAVRRSICMGDYLVELREVMEGTNDKLDGSIYNICVKIIHPEENEKIQVFSIFDTNTRNIFSSLKLGSRCLLKLTKVDNNKYHFDKIIWYQKGEKYCLNEGNQIISKEQAKEMAGYPIP
jgi:hypothetical protein